MSAEPALHPPSRSSSPTARSSTRRPSSATLATPRTSSTAAPWPVVRRRPRRRSPGAAASGAPGPRDARLRAGLFGARFALLRPDNITKGEREKLEALFARHPRVAVGWRALQALYGLYLAEDRAGATCTPLRRSPSSTTSSTPSSPGRRRSSPSTRPASVQAPSLRSHAWRTGSPTEPTSKRGAFWPSALEWGLSTDAVRHCHPAVKGDRAPTCSHQRSAVAAPPHGAASRDSRAGRRLLPTQTRGAGILAARLCDDRSHRVQLSGRHPMNSRSLNKHPSLLLAMVRE